MEERFQLMNHLYQLIVAEQAHLQIPESEDPIDKNARQVMEALRPISAHISYSGGGNQYEIMVQLSKLFTAGLITFERDKGGDFFVKAVGNPNIQELQEFNDNLKR